MESAEVKQCRFCGGWFSTFVVKPDALRLVDVCQGCADLIAEAATTTPATHQHAR